MIRGIPSYTEPQLNIDTLKKYGFTANKAFIMKSKKTGYPISLYVVNVLPRAKYGEIYNIKDICYFRVFIERFKGTKIVKQCYCCQSSVMPQRYAIYRPNTRNVQASTLHQLAPNCIKILQIFWSAPGNIQTSPQTPEIHKISLFLKQLAKINPMLPPTWWRKLCLSINMLEKPETIPKESEKEPAPDPSLSQNLESANTSQNKLNIPETATTENSSNSNYSTGFKEIFKTFQDMK